MAIVKLGCLFLNKQHCSSAPLVKWSDIVEKECTRSPDRNGDSLSLRPEGTAGCVRACIEHGFIAQSAAKTLVYWAYVSP